MKRNLLLVLTLVLLFAGCGEKKETIIGKWKTSYELAGMGKVEEIYEFKEENKCIRTLIVGTDIKNDCTYEFNKDKTQIKIVWQDKLYKDGFDEYQEIDNNKIKIGDHTYTKDTSKKKK